MISNIAGLGLHHQLSSSPSNVTSQASISSHDKDDETSKNSPIPDDSRKVNGTVNSQESQAGKRETQKQNKQDEGKTANARNGNSPVELNEEELKQIQELKQRDIEVRAHEAAHLAAAGQHAQGGAKFTLQRGPDGQSYAIGGSVSIDTSPEANPEATIRKADQIKRAALAPAEPSGQDRSVAAQASKLRVEAQAKLAEEQQTQSVERDEAAPEPATGMPNSDDKLAAETTTTSSREQMKTEGEATCAVCGGAHPTGPHLESNQRKTDQYFAPVQDQEPLLNRVA